MALPGLPAERMIQLYRQRERRQLFLSTFFKTIPGSTGGTGTTVTWDIIRGTRTIAGTIDRDTGSRLNTVQQFTSKQIEPPFYGEKQAIDARSLVNRRPGEDPWTAGNTPVTARFLAASAEGMAQMGRLIDYGVELQAAQIMQTGMLALPGVKPYAADFLPKSSHFVTVAIPWVTPATAVPLTDMAALADQISLDSNRQVTRAIFGATAWAEFLAADQVQETANLLRMNLIDVDPQMREKGATRMGVVTVGTYDIELWRYNGLYTPYGGGADVPYVDADKVILLPDDPAFVIASLQVPRVLGPDPRIPSSLVSPPTTSAGGWDITPNVYCDDSGDVITTDLKANVLLFPQGIDEFGCLAT